MGDQGVFLLEGAVLEAFRGVGFRGKRTEPRGGGLSDLAQKLFKRFGIGHSKMALLINLMIDSNLLIRSGA